MLLVGSSLGLEGSLWLPVEGLALLTNIILPRRQSDV